MTSTVFIRETFNGLSDHLEIAYHSILNHCIPLVRLFSGRNIEANLCGALDNMGQIDARILGHSGVASFRMRRRSSQ